jgi:hypothetical protein
MMDLERSTSQGSVLIMLVKTLANLKRSMDEDVNAKSMGFACPIPSTLP